MDTIDLPVISIWLPLCVVRESSLQQKARQHNKNHWDGSSQFKVDYSETQYPKELENSNTNYPNDFYYFSVSFNYLGKSNWQQ
jgi:hypothetical protein